MAMQEHFRHHQLQLQSLQQDIADQKSQLAQLRVRFLIFKTNSCHMFRISWIILFINLGSSVVNVCAG
jgi:hypothetical protein